MRSGLKSAKPNMRISRDNEHQLGAVFRVIGQKLVLHLVARNAERHLPRAFRAGDDKQPKTDEHALRVLQADAQHAICTSLVGVHLGVLQADAQRGTVHEGVRRGGFASCV